MKIRREYPHFAPWDAHGMSAHLEAMEAKGWRFRGTNWLGLWEYAPGEPKHVRYAVAYAPSRKNWRLTPTEAERDLEDLCFVAGWRKIAALSRFHIYRNADPEATALETDEMVRLDTLDRSLGAAAGIGALVWLLAGAVVLALLGWALHDQLPRALAVPMLPFACLFALWLMVSQMVPWLMYRRWLRSARAAAAGGQPCPAVRGWRGFSRWDHWFTAVLLLWMAAGGQLAILLVYGAVLYVFYGLRHLLEHRMQDEALAENLWQILLVVTLIVLFGLNRWYGAGTSSLQTGSIPLMAQHFRDTEGMELQQFSYNSNDSLLASYHNYWQSDGLGPFDLQYTIFDLRLAPMDAACDEWFLADFDSIAQRKDAAAAEADAALWNAERALYFSQNGEDHWLIFYNGRTVELFTSWRMTEAEIAAAAEKLAP